MTLNQLKALNNTNIDQLTISSHEGGIYTLEVTVNNKTEPLYMNDTLSATHDSIDGIRRKLEDVSVNEVYLIQPSPYDEMIGLPSSTQSHKLPLRW